MFFEVSTCDCPGLSYKTRVVIYGRDSTAAARLAAILMYAGVEDVRLLNGGLSTWTAAGFPLSTESVKRPPSANFGVPVPAHPEWIVGIHEARRIIASEHARLVSVRSWPEYIGETSGYWYITARGRIRGAVWGHAGTSADPMRDYHNPDGTLRNYHEIAANWLEWGITPENQIAFSCGTGWRASEAFFAAYVMGFDRISVYDGGWLEWSDDRSNPIETGVPPGQNPQLHTEQSLKP